LAAAFITMPAKPTKPPQSGWSLTNQRYWWATTPSDPTKEASRHFLLSRPLLKEEGSLPDFAESPSGTPGKRRSDRCRQKKSPGVVRFGVYVGAL